MRTPVTLPAEPSQASAPAWERTYPGTASQVRLVRAEVRDQGSDWDGDLATSARHPHGLGLVTALTAACGTGPGPDRSRLVWARIDDHAGPVPGAPAHPGQDGPKAVTRLR